MPILFTFLIYTTFLRGIGDTRTPFFALILNTALTLALTPALSWAGSACPPFGTNGAAVGNVIASPLTLIAMLAYLSRTGNELRLRPADAGQLAAALGSRRQDRRGSGFPTGINLVMVSLSEIAVLEFVNAFGSTATAAYGAVNQVVSYVQFPAITIGIGASIFGAQAIGARRLERIPKIVRSAVSLNYAIEGL